MPERGPVRRRRASTSTAATIASRRSSSTQIGQRTPGPCDAPPLPAGSGTGPTRRASSRRRRAPPALCEAGGLRRGTRRTAIPRAARAARRAGPGPRRWRPSPPTAGRGRTRMRGSTTCPAPSTGSATPSASTTTGERRLPPADRHGERRHDHRHRGAAAGRRRDRGQHRRRARCDLVPVRLPMHGGRRLPEQLELGQRCRSHRLVVGRLRGATASRRCLRTPARVPTPSRSSTRSTAARGAHVRPWATSRTHRPTSSA